MKKKYWEEIIIALSLANLLFISGWRGLIYPSSAVYHIKLVPSYFDYASLMLLVVIFAGGLLGGLWLSRYFLGGRTPIIVKWFHLLILLCVLNVIRIQFSEYEMLFVRITGRIGLLLIVGATFVIVIATAIKLQESFFAFIRTVTIILSPFFLITFSQAFWGIINSDLVPSDIEFSNATITNKNDRTQIKTRVVWIVFDELDYRMAFEKRPVNVKMPEFDRLQRESFYSTHATAPARETLEAMPSLIIGKKIKKAVPKNQSDLWIRQLDEDGLKDFSSLQNVFGEVKQLGGNTAIIGWYHSYCRVLQQDLSSCYWEGHLGTRSKGLGKAVLRRLVELAISLPFGYRLTSRLQIINDLDFEETLEKHNNILGKTRVALENSELDLTLIHLPIPHAPFIYNRKTNDLTGGGNYLDNLILADQVLGEIRLEMEKSDLWNNSTLIISSDHQWRVNDHKHKFTFTEEEAKVSGRLEDPRIPFIVKLANQEKGMQYNNPFNTVITYNLILSVIKGEISTAEEIEDFIDKKQHK